LFGESGIIRYISLQGRGAKIFSRFYPIHSHVGGLLSFRAATYDPWESII
jgi:hypothetical protein